MLQYINNKALEIHKHKMKMTTLHEYVNLGMNEFDIVWYLLTAGCLDICINYSS